MSESVRNGSNTTNNEGNQMVVDFNGTNKVDIVTSNEVPKTIDAVPTNDPSSETNRNKRSWEEPLLSKDEDVSSTLLNKKPRPLAGGGTAAVAVAKETNEYEGDSGETKSEIIRIPSNHQQQPTTSDEHNAPAVGKTKDLEKMHDESTTHAIENNGIESTSAAMKVTGEEEAKDSIDRMNDADEELEERASEIVSEYIDLKPMPAKIKPLAALTKAEKRELEVVLEIGKADSWRDDWIGNLAFADKDVTSPDSKSRDRNNKKPLLMWARKGKTSLRLLNFLLRHVYNLKETPQRAKDVLASVNPNSVDDIQEAIRRVSYDPVVLQQDGWTTRKSAKPIGASGGPYRIGEMVYWQGYEGVVIAYIHDHDLGDLWKAMWLEEFDTFDLEVEELDDARKKYKRRQKQKQNADTSEQSASKAPGSSAATAVTAADLANSRRSARYASSADFHVEGIEHGIILAVSYSRGSRPGVFWPARVLHASEIQSFGAQNKRGSQKQKLDVLFLAPYWNASPVAAGSRSYAESLQRHGSSIFSSGPLFEFESIDVSAEVIQEYPYDGEHGLDIEQLRVSFKFAGLPKAAFPRFVDSHRLALGLKTYSQKRLNPKSTEVKRTTAGLFETHPLSVQTALFPQSVLHLPFEHILSQLPSVVNKDNHDAQSYDGPQTKVEPSLQLGVILDTMNPPFCWGQGQIAREISEHSPEVVPMTKTFQSPPIPIKLDGNEIQLGIDHFITDLGTLKGLLANDSPFSMSFLLKTCLKQLLAKFPQDQTEFEGASKERRRDKARNLAREWAIVKVRAHAILCSAFLSESINILLRLRVMERNLYQLLKRNRGISEFRLPNGGDCVNGCTNT